MGEEVLAFAKLLGVLAFAVHRGVDGAQEPAFCVSKSHGDVRESDVADEHEIHVAGGDFFSPGDGAKDEGRRNALRARLEGIAKHVSDLPGTKCSP